MDDAIKNDVLYIGKLVRFYNLKDKKNVEKIRAFSKAKGILQSSYGIKFLERAEKLSAGYVDNTGCIFCGKEASNNGVICQGCLSKIPAGSENTIPKTPVREAENNVPLPEAIDKPKPKAKSKLNKKKCIIWVIVVLVAIGAIGEWTSGSEETEPKNDSVSVSSGYKSDSAAGSDAAYRIDSATGGEAIEAPEIVKSFAERYRLNFIEAMVDQGARATDIQCDLVLKNCKPNQENSKMICYYYDFIFGENDQVQGGVSVGLLDGQIEQSIIATPYDAYVCTVMASVLTKTMDPSLSRAASLAVVDKLTEYVDVEVNYNGRVYYWIPYDGGYIFTIRLE